MTAAVEDILQAKVEIAAHAVGARLGKDTHHRGVKEAAHRLHLIGVALGLLIIKHLQVQDAVDDADAYHLVVILIDVLTLVDLRSLPHRIGEVADLLDHAVGVCRAGSDHHVPLALEVRVARQSDAERAVNGGQDAGQVNLSDVRNLAKHRQQLLYLLELYKAVSLHAHREDIVHRVGNCLEDIAIGFAQYRSEQLGILATLVGQDARRHLDLIVIQLDIASHCINVTLGENLDQRHLARELAVNVALAQDGLQPLALDPCVDGRAAIVEQFFDLLVIDDTGGRLGQDATGGTCNTRHLHGLVDGAHEEHLAVDGIEVVTHIHAIQPLDLGEIAADAQFESLAGLGRVVELSQQYAPEGLGREIGIGLAVGVQPHLWQVAEQHAQGRGVVLVDHLAQRLGQDDIATI